MKIDDVNLCMTILDIFESDARAFFDYVIESNPVTKDGAWGTVSWWNQMAEKYRKTGAVACGGGALASAAEFVGESKNIPAEVYLRLWTLMAPSIHAKEAFDWLGSFGGKYVPALRQYLSASPSVIYEHCNNGTMTLKNALGLIEYLDPENVVQNRLVEFVAETDETLLPLALYLKTNGGEFYGLSKIC
jgi:hypothetical protein